LLEEKFPFVYKNIFLIARVNEKSGKQELVIQELDPNTNAVLAEDRIQCIHTAVIDINVSEFQGMVYDLDAREDLYKKTLQIRSTENLMEINLTSTEKFFALRSWVQGIAEAGLDAISIQGEIDKVANLQYPISSFLLRFLLNVKKDLFPIYIEKIIKNCRYEGGLHKPCLIANLIPVLDWILNSSELSKNWFIYDEKSFLNKIDEYLEYIFDIEPPIELFLDNSNYRFMLSTPKGLKYLQRFLDKILNEEGTELRHNNIKYNNIKYNSRRYFNNNYKELLERLILKLYNAFLSWRYKTFPTQNLKRKRRVRDGLRSINEINNNIEINELMDSEVNNIATIEQVTTFDIVDEEVEAPIIQYEMNRSSLNRIFSVFLEYPYIVNYILNRNNLFVLFSLPEGKIYLKNNLEELIAKLYPNLEEKEAKLMLYLSSKVGLIPKKNELTFQRKSIGYIEKNRHVIALNLYSKALLKLPANINSLEYLERLYLDRNLLTYLPNLSGLKKLREISLQYNEFNEFPEELLSKNLINLEKIDLSNNNLDFIPLTISILPFLKELKLDSNNFYKFPINILSLVSLRVLSISNNFIGILPENLCNLKNLEKFIAINCHLIDLNKNFGKLTNLRELFLANNSLRKFPDSFKNLSKLEVLDIENNLIKQIPTYFSKFKKLKSLNINFNFSELYEILDNSDVNIVSEEEKNIINSTDKLNITRNMSNFINSNNERNPKKFVLHPIRTNADKVAIYRQANIIRSLETLNELSKSGVYISIKPFDLNYLIKKFIKKHEDSN